ncbi:hypothetical protein [Microbacterium sp. SORGH_AS_0888]|uniref:hypothetical protein n=1 Tax=Microbacterium sp. SORGH_AS_0888 TaxID=3041791 RepID=UPI002789E9F3|nr:hypothetical protein [Microbacterium sp. SORGH_AS_0888]MDQ1128676.1 hypothetical protein [Microbacterium sp. SORGH_AS_0888]
MSTPDQPSTPPLTRRQLREIRNTGSTPIVSEETTEEPTAPEQPAPPAPLPRAAEPAAVAPAPRPDASVDLGVSPLTRRQAREQERIRTASIPVVSADVAPEPAFPPVVVPALDVEPVVDVPAVDAEAAAEVPVTRAEEALGTAPSSEAEAPVTVSEKLGSKLLKGQAPDAALPASFDQLLTRDSSSTGAVATPNALILTQTPSAPLVGPVTATGEVIITGTFDLPEGLGSRGHATGAADGTEVDAVLIDGELPPASSPTPIAASAAISTVKAADEIIRPPAPEKGSRLMLALAITAGALALALVGVLILAFVTGVFS